MFRKKYKLIPPGEEPVSYQPLRPSKGGFPIWLGFISAGVILFFVVARIVKGPATPPDTARLAEPSLPTASPSPTTAPPQAGYPTATNNGAAPPQTAVLAETFEAAATQAAPTILANQTIIAILQTPVYIEVTHEVAVPYYVTSAPRVERVIVTQIVNVPQVVTVVVVITATPAPTATATATASPTATATDGPSPTPTETPTATPTATATDGPSPTPTETATATASPTP